VLAVPRPRQYRRDLLRTLNADLEAERRLVNELMLRAPKNYQLW